MSEHKRQIRKRMTELRRGIGDAEHASWSARICEQMTALPEWKAAKTVALFASIRKELDTRPLLDAALAARKVLALPVTTERGQALRFHRVDDLSALVPARFGVPEPSPGSPVVHGSEIDLMVLPGLAFDQRGHRIGYGAGYYDRTIEAAPQAVRVGVCFSVQLIDEVPAEAHDQPAHAVVTELGVTRPRHP